MPQPGYSRMATVLDAVDIGYRVIVVHDVVCGSSDEGRDVVMRLYHGRYTEQQRPSMPPQSSGGGNDL